MVSNASNVLIYAALFTSEKNTLESHVPSCINNMPMGTAWAFEYIIKSIYRLLFHRLFITMAKEYSVFLLVLMMETRNYRCVVGFFFIN